MLPFPLPTRGLLLRPPVKTFVRTSLILPWLLSTFSHHYPFLPHPSAALVRTYYPVLRLVGRIAIAQSPSSHQPSPLIKADSLPFLRFLSLFRVFPPFAASRSLAGLTYLLLLCPARPIGTPASPVALWSHLCPAHCRRPAVGLPCPVLRFRTLDKLFPFPLGCAFDHLSLPVLYLIILLDPCVWLLCQLFFLTYPASANA